MTPPTSSASVAATASGAAPCICAAAATAVAVNIASADEVLTINTRQLPNSGYTSNAANAV
jgi:hypothetical protein